MVWNGGERDTERRAMPYSKPYPSAPDGRFCGGLIHWELRGGKIRGRAFEGKWGVRWGGELSTAPKQSGPLFEGSERKREGWN